MYTCMYKWSNDERVMKIVERYTQFENAVKSKNKQCDKNKESKCPES